MGAAYAFPLDRSTFSPGSYKLAASVVRAARVAGDCRACRIGVLGLEHLCHSMIKGGVCCRGSAGAAARASA
ncbi:MAG: hypothetical protein C4575_00600 [Desulforudis sp.]|jgi:hypothetical protein|nr:MAG: hypothetical protein C4575_00600 [Desulforudis sp.]